MKTFETEKSNIPEGATHYANETDTDCFIWYREDTKEVMVDGYVVNEWELAGSDEALDDLKPIPQIKEVEWVNGDDVDAYGKPYKYVGLDPFNENLCICLANQDDDPQCFSIDALKKPETEAEKLEREEIEAAYDLYCEWHKLLGHESIRHISTFKDDDEYAIFRFFIARQKNTI